MKKSRTTRKNGKEKEKTRKGKSKTGVVSKVVRAPAAQGKILRSLGQPQVQNLGSRGDILVVHREYISDLISSATASAFSLLGVPINPGNSAMFPWLSGLAKKFESYLFRGLKFCFETDAPSTQAGSVLMAVDFEPGDPLPVSKQELMSRRGAVRTVDWADVDCSCVREDLNKRSTYYVADSNEVNPRYVVGSSSASSFPVVGRDVRLDNVGEFLVASSNCPSSANLGELYVEYQVELRTPDLVNDVPAFFGLWAKDAVGQTTSTLLGSTPSDDIDTTSGGDGLNVLSTAGVRYDNDSNGHSVLYFSSPGTYYVSTELAGWSTTATNFITNTFTVPSNATKHDNDAFGAGTGVGTANIAQNFFLTIPPDRAQELDSAPYVNSATKQDISFIDWTAAGTGFAHPSGAVAIIRVFKTPDWGTGSTGDNGNLPRPRRFPRNFAGSCHSSKNYDPTLMARLLFAVDSMNSPEVSSLASTIPPLEGEKESSESLTLDCIPLAQEIPIGAWKTPPGMRPVHCGRSLGGLSLFR